MVPACKKTSASHICCHEHHPSANETGGHRKEKNIMKSQTSSQREEKQSYVPSASQHATVASFEKPSKKLQSSNKDLRDRISERAYELYAQRGWREGGALEDWLDAEREILGLHLL